MDNQQRQRQVDHAIAALYRWYVAKSQPRRLWNADTDFAWADIRHDLPEDILRIVQGFYAVEQFIPDYAANLVGLLRRNYGRSQFYLKWGAEESKHADLWQNVLLATGYLGSSAGRIAAVDLCWTRSTSNLSTLRGLGTDKVEHARR